MEPEIILYDLACTKGVCFSPTVWRVRLSLNYKKIPYKTVFLEFPDIDPTLKDLGVAPAEAPKIKYTVPTIHHAPTKQYIMDSVAITAFLQENYPEPPFILTSDLGQTIEKRSRGAIGKAFRVSIAPRELAILSPRSQEYFRKAREAELGHALEDLLVGEDEVWASVAEEQQAVSDLIETNALNGPFVVGMIPSATDFFIAGALQSARIVEPDVLERILKFRGFAQIFDACQPWMNIDE